LRNHLADRRDHGLRLVDIGNLVQARAATPLVVTQIESVYVSFTVP